MQRRKQRRREREGEGRGTFSLLSVFLTTSLSLSVPFQNLKIEGGGRERARSPSCTRLLLHAKKKNRYRVCVSSGFSLENFSSGLTETESLKKKESEKYMPIVDVITTSSVRGLVRVATTIGRIYPFPGASPRQQETFLLLLRLPASISKWKWLFSWLRLLNYASGPLLDLIFTSVTKNNRPAKMAVVHSLSRLSVKGIHWLAKNDFFSPQVFNIQRKKIPRLSFFLFWSLMLGIMMMP
jgi:hypothetical protein